LRAEASQGDVRAEGSPLRPEAAVAEGLRHASVQVVQRPVAAQAGPEHAAPAAAALQRQRDGRGLYPCQGLADRHRLFTVADEVEGDVQLLRRDAAQAGQVQRQGGKALAQRRRQLQRDEEAEGGLRT